VSSARGAVQWNTGRSSLRAAGRAVPAAGRIALNQQGIFRHHPELDAGGWRGLGAELRGVVHRQSYAAGLGVQPNHRAFRMRSHRSG
jgi:hypothetical protein